MALLPLTYACSFALAGWQSAKSGQQQAAVAWGYCAVCVAQLALCLPMLPRQWRARLHALTAMICYIVQVAILLGISDVPGIALKGEFASLLTSIIVNASHEVGKDAVYPARLHLSWPLMHHPDVPHLSTSPATPTMRNHPACMHAPCRPTPGTCCPPGRCASALLSSTP